MNFKSLVLISSLSLSSLLYAAPVASVNGSVIPAERLDNAMSQAISHGQKNTPELRAFLREQLIREELLAQEASRKGLDKTADFNNKLQTVRTQILSEALYNSISKQLSVTDAEIQAEYDRVSKQRGGKEIQLNQIVLKTEAEANAIIVKLKAGEKFANLAKSKSIDPNSKNKGGDIGWTPLAVFPPEISASLSALAKGATLEKPLSANGVWYVMQMQGQRDAKIPALKQVKEQIKQQLQGQKSEKYIGELRSKAKIQ